MPDPDPMPEPGPAAAFPREAGAGAVPPEIEVIDRLRLWPFVATGPAGLHRAAMGMWTAYVPALSLKLLHAVDGHVHCLSRRAPKRHEILTPKLEPAGRAADWRRAFSTPVIDRVAENWVILCRLYRAGLGPEPLSLVVVPRYRAWFSGGWTFTAGYRVANLRDQAPKLPATEADLRAAGVIPDRTLSSIREQINGYVSDLNSLHPPRPDNAGPEVAAIRAALAARLGQEPGTATRGD